MSEIGAAKNTVGPFATEWDAHQDAVACKAGPHVTGRKDDGWYWASESDYLHISGKPKKTNRVLHRISPREVAAFSKQQSKT